MVDLYIISLGPIIGSFLALVADRWPSGHSIGGRSYCLSCKKSLSWLQLIPLFSYIFQQGKCNCCQAKIPFRLFAIEMIALICVIPVVFITDPFLKSVTALLAWSLLLLALTDLKYYWLPDAITLPLIVTGLAWTMMTYPHAVPNHALGAALGYSTIWSLRALYLKVKGIEAIGLGDAKLLAAAGAWLGWPLLPPLLLIASVSGILVTLIGQRLKSINNQQKISNIDQSHVSDEPKKANQKIAFGVYLVVAFYGLWLQSSITAIILLPF